MVESSKKSINDFTLENFVFGPGVLVDTDLLKVSATSIQKEGSFRDCVLFMKSSGEIVKSRGKLLKSPSILIHDIYIEFEYDKIAGVIVPIHLNSTGQVHFFGPATLEETYEYESINGVLLK